MEIEKGSVVDRYITRNKRVILVNDSALAVNGLVYTGSSFSFCTKYKNLDMFEMAGMRLEYYHLSDDRYLREVLPNVYAPSAEKAIIDTIKFLKYNCNEGFLVEALQDYIEDNRDIDELFKVGQEYGVGKNRIKYWLNEAIGYRKY